MRLTPDKKLHSREHLLAEDLSRMLAEPKRFAAYLGIAYRYEESDLWALARQVLEKKDLPLEARGKYFFAALRGMRQKPEYHKKKRKLRRRTKKHVRRKTAKRATHRARTASRTAKKSA